MQNRNAWINKLGKQRAFTAYDVKKEARTACACNCTLCYVRCIVQLRKYSRNLEPITSRTATSVTMYQSFPIIPERQQSTHTINMQYMFKYTSEPEHLSFSMISSTYLLIRQNYTPIHVTVKMKCITCH